MEGVDIQRLQAWMDDIGLGEGPIDAPQLLTGGTQNMLVRFQRAGRDYVMRRPPLLPRPASNETMKREARVLQALTATDVPHPGFIAVCPDEEVLGAAFYLMEPVTGFNPVNGLPDVYREQSKLRRRMGFAMIDAIAKLAAVDHLAAGLDGFGRPDNYLERQVERWRSQLASYDAVPGWSGSDAIPGVDKVADWLDAHLPPAVSPGIIHGDFHFANVMFRPDDGEVAAIVDWELSTIGDPLIDLGWMLATWPDTDTPDPAHIAVEPWQGFARHTELINRYAAQSSRDLSHLDWYIILACYKLGIILEGTHARACAGKAPREIGDQLHRRTISLFERALERIS